MPPAASLLSPEIFSRSVCANYLGWEGFFGSFDDDAVAVVFLVLYSGGIHEYVAFDGVALRLAACDGGGFGGAAVDGVVFDCPGAGELDRGGCWSGLEKFGGFGVVVVSPGFFALGPVDSCTGVTDLGPGGCGDGVVSSLRTDGAIGLSGPFPFCSVDKGHDLEASDGSFTNASLPCCVAVST